MLLLVSIRVYARKSAWDCSRERRALRKAGHCSPGPGTRNTAWFVEAHCTKSLKRRCFVLRSAYQANLQDQHDLQVCSNRVTDYQYQFEDCRDLDTWYMAHGGIVGAGMDPVHERLDGVLVLPAWYCLA